MKLILAALIISLVTAASCWPVQDKQAKRPVDVFAKFEGKWRGTFVVYDTAGRELNRIEVEQEYATIDANTQSVRIRDRMPDGKVITGKGTNTAHRDKDGKLVLQCTVNKSNGEKSIHAGRVVKGPGGGTQLVWYSKGKDKTETFREWVQQEGKRTTYHIHGLGQYGETLLLMAGDYTKLDK